MTTNTDYIYIYIKHYIFIQTS